MSIQPRHIRNLSSLSEAECAALRDKHVCIVGCGGLGGYAIEQLTRIGVGNLTVIDGDVFEESNLNRQILATEDVLGTPKVAVAEQRMRAIDPDVNVTAHHTLLNEQNARQLIAHHDCVIDALDNVTSRFWLAHACREEGIPLVYGAIAGWFGQVCTIMPEDASFATIYGAPEHAGEGMQKRLGNLPFTAAATASVQAAECIKILLGKNDILQNRLFMIDLFDGTCDTMELA